MPGPLRRIAWCVGGVVFPCRHLPRPSTIEPMTRPSLETLRNGMWFIRSRESPKPRSLSLPPREKGQDLTTRRVFLRLAVPPRTHGPGFPGAWAGGPLSRAATSPLRRASRHPFAVHVFQQADFPRGLVLAGVRRPLGSRTRFRALCLTPRFFEPRCRQTNSAISLSTHGHTHRTDILVRADVCRHVSPQHRSPEGDVTSHAIPRGVAPRHLRAGARAPEATPRKAMAMNMRGSGDPSEGPTEAGSPPQAPPERPGHHLDLKLGMVSQPRAPRQP